MPMNLHLRVNVPLAVAAACLFGVGAVNAQSGAVITTGLTSLGVNQTGELNFGGVGLSRDGIGDAIFPGCPCEGWGVSLTSGSSSFATFANQSSGSGGFAPGNSFSFTGSTATSVVGMADLPVTIRHAFGPSLQADVFQVQVTVTNNGDSTLDNLVYRRAMDWDVPPSPFSEYVTHGGVVANLTTNGGNVLFAGNNGFASSDPRESAEWGANIQPLRAGGSIDTTNTNFVQAGPADHGSVFDFGFGQLAAGQSRTFNIYYGSAANESGALAKVGALGANVYSLGQSSGISGGGDGEGGGGEVPTLMAMAAAAPGDHEPSANPTFLFAFGGVGGTALGSTQETPILPFVVADPTTGAPTFTFDAPVSGRWYDPPFTTAFTIKVVGGNMISIMAPMGFNDLKVLVGGVEVDSDFDEGETFTFASGVGEFVITGFPWLDQADPGYATAFPLFMNFESTVTGMTWTPTTAVPEPQAYAMMVLGLAVTGWIARRRRGIVRTDIA